MTIELSGAGINVDGKVDINLAGIYTAMNNANSGTGMD